MRLAGALAAMVLLGGWTLATRKKKASKASGPKSRLVVASVDMAEMVMIALATDTVDRLDGTSPSLTPCEDLEEEIPPPRQEPRARALQRMRVRWTREMAEDAPKAIATHIGGDHGFAFANHVISEETLGAVEAALATMDRAQRETFGGTAALSGKFVVASRRLAGVHRSAVFRALREMDVRLVESRAAVGALARLAESAERQGRAEMLQLCLSETSPAATAAFYLRVLQFGTPVKRALLHVLPVNTEAFGLICRGMEPSPAASRLLAAIGGDSQETFVPYLLAAQGAGRNDVFLYMLMDGRAPPIAAAPLPEAPEDRAQITSNIFEMETTGLRASSVLRLAALLMRLERPDAAAQKLAVFMHCPATNPVEYARVLAGSWCLGIPAVFGDARASASYDRDDFLTWVCLAAQTAGRPRDDPAVACVAREIAARTGASWDRILLGHMQSYAVVLQIMPEGTPLSQSSLKALRAHIKAELKAKKQGTT